MLLQFDTRKKKPKVWNIAVMALITGVILFLLVRTGEPDRLKWGCLVLSAFFSLTVILLADAFRKQLQYNPYSYNTIIYSGFAIFSVYVAATYIYLTVHGFQTPEQVTEQRILLTLLYSARNYLILTAPFLLIFSIALFVSNVSLIRHEGKRFVNILGMILAVLIVTGAGVIIFAERLASGSGISNRYLGPLINLASVFYLYFECMIVGTIIAGVIAAKYVPEKDKDILIVLGCGLMSDGTPTPLLRGRAGLAKSFREEQLRSTGKQACFLVSGGQGPDEVRSEAASMKDWLIGQGIPEELILTEDRSADTAENMRFSKEIIDKVMPDAKVAFFTTNYHVFRAGLKARRVKMRAVGMGAPTKWYFWPNASVCEFVGLLTEHKVKQGMVLLMLVAAYVFLTLRTFG